MPPGRGGAPKALPATVSVKARLALAAAVLLTNVPVDPHTTSPTRRRRRRPDDQEEGWGRDREKRTAPSGNSGRAKALPFFLPAGAAPCLPPPRRRRISTAP